jgi:hypothetical protein
MLSFYATSNKADSRELLTRKDSCQQSVLQEAPCSHAGKSTLEGNNQFP